MRRRANTMPALTDEGVRSALVHDQQREGANPRKGSYMSTMAELRGGLTDGQRAHAARQRQQLQLDLQQQVRRHICVKPKALPLHYILFMRHPQEEFKAESERPFP